MSVDVTVELLRTEATVEMISRDVVCELPKTEITVEVEE